MFIVADLVSLIVYHNFVEYVTWSKFYIVLRHANLNYINMFVCFESLRPSQQFFSYVGMGLSGMNPY